MPEIKSWIPGHEGRYQITTEGRVISWRSGEPEYLKLSVHDNGHTRVSLLLDDGERKRFYVHRLMWWVFKGEKLPPKEWLIHKDGDRTNNRLTNLEKKNVVLNGRGKNKSIRYQVIENSGLKRGFSNMDDLCKLYGISYGRAITALKSGKEISIISKKNL